MNRTISISGLDFIKRWEGLRTTAYQCSASVWTIGYGHTAAAGDPVPEKGMTIPEKEALALLRRDLQQYENTVEQSVNVKLTDDQFAALVSFAYNVGIKAFQRSTLLRKLNSGDYDAVPDELGSFL